MNNQFQWVITIIIIMATFTYLNQEVPACVENTLPENNLTINYNQKQVEEIQEAIQSDIIVFKTSGASMQPIISDNQRCVCMKSDSYEIGDIVVYFADFGEGFQGIAHQIINLAGETVITKGTNNELADNPIKQENILCEIPTIRRYELWTN